MSRECPTFKPTAMKTVRQHIEDIENPEIKAKCLLNLDERCADMTCNFVGYALMLGVEQPAHERAYWDKVYKELNKGEDHSRFYTMPVH